MASLSLPNLYLFADNLLDGWCGFMAFSLVLYQDTFGRIGLRAAFVDTFVWLVSGMDSKMSLKDAFLIERFGTSSKGTLEDSFTRLVK